VERDEFQVSKLSPNHLSRLVLHLKKLVRHGQRRISIRSLLTLLFLTISIAPTILIGYLFYKQSASTMFERINNYSSQIVELSAERIGNKLADIEAYSIETAYAERVQAYLEGPVGMSSWEHSQQLARIRQDFGIKISRQNEDFVVTIIHPDQSQTIIYGDPALPFALKPDQQSNLYEQAVAKNGATFLLPASEEMHLENVWFQRVRQSGNTKAIILARSIKTLYRGEVNGVLAIRISERFINQLYRAVNLGTDTHSFLIDPSGIIYASGDHYYNLSDQGKPLLLQAVLAQDAQDPPSDAAGPDQLARQVRTWSDGQTEFLVFSAPVPGFDLNFVSMLPVSYVNAELNRTALGTIMIMLAIAGAMLVLSTTLAFVIANPLRRLIKGMHAARKGNLAISVDTSSIREVEEVSTNFNEMMEEINQLLIRIKDKEKQKRIAEIKALQAQINPHFLANTLNTARWMANIQGAHNIEDLVGSLIQLINASIGARDDQIPIQEELENIQAFLRIQEYRYFDKFKVQYQIEPEILDCLIPRLLLQPLVENALVHGIAPVEGQGTLVIRGLIEGETIRLQVTDNGKGISAEHLAAIEQGLKPANQHGIGIRNVRDRIRLNFGDRYGLVIKSVPDLYTTCEITLPRIEPDAHDESGGRP